MSFEGGCRCSACRYVLNHPVVPDSYACHCINCQTMTGSGFSLHAVVPTSRFAMVGELEGWSRLNGEGCSYPHVCAVCKNRIHSTNVGHPGLVIVRTGTLADSRDVVPLVHMWVGSKQSWIGLPTGADTYDGAIPAERLKSVFALNLTEEPPKSGQSYSSPLHEIAGERVTGGLWSRATEAHVASHLAHASRYHDEIDQDAGMFRWA